MENFNKTHRVDHVHNFPQRGTRVRFLKVCFDFAGGLLKDFVLGVGQADPGLQCFTRRKLNAPPHVPPLAPENPAGEIAQTAL